MCEEIARVFTDYITYVMKRQSMNSEPYLQKVMEVNHTGPISIVTSSNIDFKVWGINDESKPVLTANWLTYTILFGDFFLNVSLSNS